MLVWVPASAAGGADDKDANVGAGGARLFVALCCSPATFCRWIWSFLTNSSRWVSRSWWYTFIYQEYANTRMPSNLRQTTHRCMYFRSCDKDGGHTNDTIWSAVAKNPMLHHLHAYFTALSTTEPQLLTTEVLGNLLLWPWAWPS